MSLSKRSKIALIVLVTMLLGAFIGYKIIYKPHPSIENLSSDFKGNAVTFKTEVINDTEKWQNAIVEIGGIVTAVDKNGIVVSESIFCQLKKKEAFSKLKEGKRYKIKGRFIGYDDLLEEIKLDQCIILK